MIRKGMWCVDQDGRVGIANRIGPDEGDPLRGVPALADEAEFHVVDDAGATSLVAVVPLDALVQARYREIPEPRRTLSREQFAALGYA